MGRKLASIQKIESIEPIEGADSIEKATILGWSCVVAKKDGFKPGDLCVYCEIDSVMPDRPEFEFLRARKFRIRTIRLKGQVSQGIAFPLDIIGIPPSNKVGIGDDVSELLGVTQFVVPIPACLSGICKSTFPKHIPQTDEMRIQAVPKVLIRNKGKKMYVTEKLDGSSITVWNNEDGLQVASRRMWLEESETNAYWIAANSLGLKENFKDIGVALQGELIGPGIQKNRYNLKEFTVRWFSAYNTNTGVYLGVNEFFLLMAKYKLEAVPYLYSMELNHSVDEIIALSEGASKLNPDIHREGIVIRSIEEGRDEDLGRLSFKAINPNYLLKYEE